MKPGRLPAPTAEHVFTELKILAARHRPQDAVAIAESMIAGLVPVQRAFALDTSKRIAVCCARQVGKTHTLLRRWFRRCKLKAKRPLRLIYAAKSRDQAKQILWDDLLARNDSLGLGGKANHSELTLRLPGNHLIKLGGADDTKDIEKYRGLGNDEVAVDEAQSSPSNLLRHFLERVLGPTLKVRNGRLIVMGTPSPVMSGEWFEIAGPGATRSRPWRARESAEWKARPFKWSLHSWGARDVGDILNEDGLTLWDRFLAEKAENGWTDEAGVWQREYLGNWVTDESGFVYPYDAQRNGWIEKKPGPRGNVDDLPKGHEWWFVYGVDIGVHDPCAIQVFAFSNTHPVCYQVYEYSQTGLTIDEIGELLVALTKVTGMPVAIVGDDPYMGGTYLTELGLRFGLRVERAERKAKLDHIALMQADLLSARVQVLRSSHLADEMSALQWDDTGLKENKAQRNDNCDAAIYARKRAGHHFAEERAPAPPPRYTPEAIEREAEESRLRSIERRRQKREETTFGHIDDFGGDDPFDVEGKDDW